MNDSKLDLILQDLQLIKHHLKIVPNKDLVIKDLKLSISEYETFAKDELELNEKTITNQLSTLSRFLHHCKGLINKESIKSYLNTNDSDFWKSNQLKALRRYCRDFLQLGNWIEEFKFSKTRAKIKKIPSDLEIVSFFFELDFQSQLVFLTLLNTGFRLGEVLKIKIKNIDFENGMMDASNIHEGDTKHSWISFVTTQTINLLHEYLAERFPNKIDIEANLFTISSRSLQNIFKNVSVKTGISINPHLLRTIFSEKCTKANLKDKYINAFCGRVSQGVLAKNYTDYSSESLRREYDKVEQLLILSFDV